MLSAFVGYGVVNTYLLGLHLMALIWFTGVTVMSVQLFSLQHPSVLSSEKLPKVLSINFFFLARWVPL